MIRRDRIREMRCILSRAAEVCFSFRAEIGESGDFTWWLPAGTGKYVLPISAGVVVDDSRSDLMRRLRDGSPWSLLHLPVLGLRYSNQTVVVIVPWPHYAELIVQDRIGIRYSVSFPVSYLWLKCSSLGAETQPPQSQLRLETTHESVSEPFRRSNHLWRRGSGLVVDTGGGARWSLPKSLTSDGFGSQPGVGRPSAQRIPRL